MFYAILLLIIVILITACLLLVLYHDKALKLRDEVKLENEAILEKYGKIIDVDAETEKKSIELQKMIKASELRAEGLVTAAQKKAQEIAGEAYIIKGQADKYRAIATAMKNSIEGYGDEYLLPSQTVLDELAEAYSFKKAGDELKKAIDKTKKMVKDGKAASCTNPDKKENKKICQIVIDLFNTKTAQILASVKSDNYGKLRQKIEDVYTLINNKSDVLCDAQIAQQYFKSRLEELKWAVAVHELKNIEREEQNRIKEEMREEEKARQEYERAIKETEKQEEMLELAMQKAREEMEKASALEKVKYQKQLEELQVRLREAEEKNQRALSMAQQTKCGYVYVISNIGSFGENVFKVGMTRRLEPLDRVRELGDASVPFSFDVHALIYSEDAPALEKTLHDRFESNRVNKVNIRKEFFRVGLGEIKTAASELNLDVKWTMKAEALEYRESLNIEKEAQKAG